jgi:HD superfamily phosphohydrolase
MYMNRQEQIDSEILSVYCSAFPEYLKPFLCSASMRRIRGCGMHCGMEYTSFPFYKDLGSYSRYVHSLGVALILEHFSCPEKVVLSGLFHDISTPAFAHVIDFLKGDHLKQEATEERTGWILENDPEIVSGLSALGLSVEDVSDYHRYPLADNDSPRLSSDRLEYTLHNFLNYGFASLEEVKEMFGNLTVGTNEDGLPEMVFQSETIAKKFALLCLKNSKVYAADADRYSMEYLARLLKKEIGRGILSEKDLYSDEEHVISLLLSDPRSKEDWEKYRSFCRIEILPRGEEDAYPVLSKKRYIDPLVFNKGRISSLDGEANREIRAFLNEDFSKRILKACGERRDSNQE